MRNQICITSDIDWAPDEVLDYFLNLLEEYNVNVTLFMTHQPGTDLRAHEIALHPNFTSFEFDKHISDVHSLFPNAQGIRSHSFFFTERLRSSYSKFGFTYQSNVMMYKQHNITPYKMAPGTFELPLFWMDNFYMEMENNAPSFKLKELNIEYDGLKIFNFHPVHVFLNTYNMTHYEQSKKYYKDPANLVKCRNTSRPGVKDIFVELLNYINENRLPTLKLSEVLQKHLNH